MSTKNHNTEDSFLELKKKNWEETLQAKQGFISLNLNNAANNIIEAIMELGNLEDFYEKDVKMKNEVDDFRTLKYKLLDLHDRLKKLKRNWEKMTITYDMHKRYREEIPITAAELRDNLYLLFKRALDRPGPLSEEDRELIKNELRLREELSLEVKKS